MQCSNQLSTSTEFLNLSSSLDQYCDLMNEERKIIPEYKAYLFNKLKSHKYYFISWLEGESIEGNVNKMLRTLTQYVRVPIDLSQETKLQMTTLQECGVGIVKAFLLMQLKKFGLAIRNICLQEQFLDHCLKHDIIPRDYYNGYKFMVTLVKLHLSIDNGSFIDSEINVEILEDQNDIDMEERIPSLEFAAILCTKWQFNETLLSRKVSTVDILEKIYDLDPDSWVWGYLLCNRIRFVRKQYGEYVKEWYPGPKEIGAICSAFKHAPELYQPMCLAGICQSLAEILRYRTFKYWSEGYDDEHLEIGDFRFQSNQEITSFILKTAKDACEGERICFAELIRYGEILSSIMPIKYQNVELAEECLIKTLKIMPSNSKANHRMGIFLLTKKKDKANAKKFFDLAVRFEPTNFPAWMDLIQLLLSELCGPEKHENDARLNNIFELLMINSKKVTSTKQQEAQIIFMRGLHSLIKRNYENAVNFWLLKASLHSDPTISILPKMFSRYSFSVKLTDTHMDEIVKAINTRILNCEDMEKPILEEMIKHAKTTKDNINSPRPNRMFFDSSDNGPRTRSNPIPMHQKHPISEADSDDCWRNCSPASPSPSQNYSREGLNVVPNTQSDSANWRFSNSSGNSFRGGRRNDSDSRSWQQNGIHFRNGRRRSPSPESWR